MKKQKEECHICYNLGHIILELYNVVVQIQLTTSKRKRNSQHTNYTHKQIANFSCPVQLFWISLFSSKYFAWDCSSQETLSWLLVIQKLIVMSEKGSCWHGIKTDILRIPYSIFHILIPKSVYIHPHFVCLGKFADISFLNHFGAIYGLRTSNVADSRTLPFPRCLADSSCLVMIEDFEQHRRFSVAF